MSVRSDVAYRYDGSYEGFLCCVFRAVYQKEDPAEICCFEEAQPTLFYEVDVDTEPEKATRVEKSFVRIGAGPLLQNVFFSCMPQKEKACLAFLRFAYRQKGQAAVSMLSHPLVAPLMAAQKFLFNESHLFKEFLRFSDHGGALTAVIEPKNFVLPYIAPHFAARYPCEYFLIWDKTHKAAFVHTPAQQGIFPLEAFTPPPVSKEEQTMRAMWKSFYDTIEIKARHNPRCRMTHMPKRYWAHMTELCPDSAYESPLTGGEASSAAAMQDILYKGALFTPEKSLSSAENPVSHLP